MDQQYMDKYWEQLRNMGFSEDMINLYKQQVEQSMNQADSWNAQMSVFTENIKQFNQMFGGDDADVCDMDDQPQVIRLHTGSRLMPEQQWAIACGADIAFVNQQYLNDITTGMSKADCREQLSEWWDIDSTAELVDMLNWLRESGHRIEYDIIWQAINMVSMKESKAFLREYIASNELEEAVVMERLRNTRDALELFKERKLIDKSLQPDMLIWDFARIINLSRAGYDAGYLTCEAALDYMMQCVPLIKRSYTSWRHLSLSYQFARCVWNGVEMGSFETLHANMEYLLMAPESPWKRLSFR
ncbi:DUF1266 domain-containing protein [Chitinophaga polysaccharea]|uniref:DUF1266 domain-containing protein n=1 Tax=Chitinophaga TaxID=79328 RepID=UPI001455CC11|nr:MULTISPECIES: DUF1266 domain-containing protein [Chitinophaga]NLR56800.1 DUF1266 domain-containing protein [Chitinophaga polysaccharea]NLU93023.1 DUF1266 domain-containing protein [Chitinophaga sp. Ak27]